jgi:nicotinate-nucleotide pyrophosphorylase (carboxylating)
LAGGVAEAVRRARTMAPARPIEVEAETLADVEAALAAGADVILLDNMDDPSTAAAIRRIDGRARVELSGRMTVERVRALASSGAHRVSIGALTHSAPAVDLSLEIERVLDAAG